PAPCVNIKAGSPVRRTAKATSSVIATSTNNACKTRLIRNPATSAPPKCCGKPDISGLPYCHSCLLDGDVCQTQTAVGNRHEVFHALVDAEDRLEIVERHFQCATGSVMRDFLQELFALAAIKNRTLRFQHLVELFVLVVRIPLLAGMIHRIGSVIVVEGPAAPGLLEHGACLALRDDVVQQDIGIVRLDGGVDADHLQEASDGLCHFIETCVLPTH